MHHVHEATVEWRASGDVAFATRRYSRAHRWRFDGGAEVAASSSPLVVPLPYSDAAAVDPEEALVAALASCHMMSFLHLASQNGLDVLSYEDSASGHLDKREDGRVAMVRAVLHPRIAFAGDADPTLVERLHHDAHDLCYIANSVNFPVTVEPVQ
ncbi:OsmC family protein [Sphingobium sufflavum]|uniref:OsmC family protein n=1 Tax=Sphingobium sufflavum TaxID=1129547 RepID=UPI001F3EED70|nr:OsmC family protein [Sphingobium sufflavum]MCE7796996.1 OsmC family protein [Sphingobium sufflavum]